MKVIKIICVLLLTILLFFSLTGCGTTVTVNVENSEELSSTTLGNDLIYIGNHLYYDSATRIVYLKFNSMGGYSHFSAYYAPNGLPYRYNPETNTFEEIGEN